jgi:urea transport system permease protein
MAQSQKSFTKLWSLIGLAGLITIYAAPLFIGVYSASLFRDAMLFGLMALGLDYLWGKTGVLSFGHATFFGAGAYGAAIVSTKLGLDPALGAWVGLLAGIALAAGLALIIGYFLIYGGVRGSYFTIVTLALGVIAKLVVLGASGVTGGDAGLLGIPALHFPSLSGFQPLPEIGQYWFVISVVCGVTFALWWACSGRYGTLLKSIQDNERRAQALGYNTSAHLLAVFVGSAAIAALGGALYASSVGVVATDSIDMALSTQAIIFVAIGGRGTLFGPVLAAVAVIWLEQKISSFNAQLWPLFMGGLFILAVFAFPNGVLKAIEQLAAKVRGTTP